MKRIISFLLVLLVFVSLGASVVLAADESVFGTPDSLVSPITYDLPYPGMLPDSPLYFVKVLRDRVVGLLVTSNVNKSFYFLLLSDKDLASGQVLISKGKSELGVKTVVAGEKYFAQAVENAAKAKSDRLEVSELLAKLSVATVKHQEVISAMSVKNPSEAALNKAYSDSQNSQNRVQDLMKM